ncbi:MAG: GWxTD domain-containing protein [bacterium]
MKNIIATLAVLLLILTGIRAESLQAYLSYAVFNTPDNTPYLETYLVVNGKTLKHGALDDGTFQSVIDIQVIFRMNDSIVNFGKYELSGPIVTDTSNITDNLLDVQRYSLPEGEYQLEFSIHDRFDNQQPIVSYDQFSIGFRKNEAAFSDIEFLQSYREAGSDELLVKNGFRLIPYVFNFYPAAINELTFYAELYRSDEIVGDDQFLVYYYIRPFEVDKKLDQFFYRKRVEAKPVNVFLNKMDISNLPSGNYLFVMEARDRNNLLMASKEIFFQRENPNTDFNMTKMLVSNIENTFAGSVTSRDTMVQYIDYLYPISTDSEKTIAKALLEESDLVTLQKYFFNFWLERNPSSPDQAWYTYKGRVDQVNNDFKSIRIKGYRTDRGRVYLQYGKPNAMAKSYNEPEAFPYEIWQYDRLNGQSARKFVFYTRDIATNDFQLIHSNALGEINNFRWQNIIYQRTWDPYNLDINVKPDAYGSFATDFYRQPR